MAVIAFFLTAIVGSWLWDFGARLVPQVVGWLGLSLASWQLGWTFFVTTEAVHPTGALEKAEAEGRFSILTKKDALQLTREIA